MSILVRDMYKPCLLVWQSLSLWSLERGEMPPAASWAIVTQGCHVPALAEAHSPRRGPPPASCCSCQHSQVTRTGLAQTPTSASAPGRKSVSHRQALLSPWAEFSENTDKLSPSLKVPRPPHSLTQPHFYWPGSYFQHPPALKVATKDSPMDGTLTWRN